MQWFANMDALIHYVNLDGRINALYSTPSAYTEAKLKSVPAWSLNTADYVVSAIHFALDDAMVACQR